MKQKAQDPLNRSRANFVTDEVTPMVDHHGAVSLATHQSRLPLCCGHHPKKRRQSAESKADANTSASDFKPIEVTASKLKTYSTLVEAAPHR